MSCFNYTNGMRKTIWIFIGILLIAGGITTYVKRDAIQARFFSDQPEALPTAVNSAGAVNANSNVNQNVNIAANANVNAVNVKPKLPAEYNLAVPFVRQAPTNNWDATHEETCEEAAALTVHYFWTENSSFTSEDIEEQYQILIDYENEAFGDFKDTNAKQTAQFIKEIWGYERVDVVAVRSLNDIKEQVYAGRPVIIPSAGKLLKNPNFKNGGPLYHNLVVRGWLADGRIITNDPGTRKGDGYVYGADVLWNAIHDWNNGDVTNGAKVMIVVYPN